MIQRLFNSTFYLILSLLLSNAVFADSKKERVLWQKKPIPLVLNIEQERIIHFPTNVRYWIPDYLKNKLSILSANGVVYITALETIEKTRIRIQSIESQTMYLLDVATGDGSHTATELIITDEDHTDNLSSSSPVKPKRADWYVRLTRFAAQTLYDDEIRMPIDKEISRVRVNRENTVRLIRGGDIEAKPIAAWQGGGFYITAIRLKNLSDIRIPIVYDHQSIDDNQRFIAIDTDIRGNWLSAVVQHHTLAENGNTRQEDITTLYLISKRSFKESL